MIWRCDLKKPCVKFCESNEKDKCGITRKDMIKRNLIQIGKDYFNGTNIITVIHMFSRWEPGISEHMINYVFMKTEDDIILVRTQEEFINEFNLDIPQYKKESNENQCTKV